MFWITMLFGLACLMLGCVVGYCFGWESYVAHSLNDATLPKEERRSAHSEEWRRSFAYHNAHMSNPNITREMIDKAAEEYKTRMI